MATSARGRGGSRLNASAGSRPYFTGTAGKSNWGTTRSSNRRNVARRPASRSTTGNVPVAWKQCSTEFCNKISSFKTLYNQTKGPAKQGRPSPATLSSLAKWVNKGAVIQTVTSQQVAQWAKSTQRKSNVNTRNITPTACKNILCAKFGKSAIKAVARTKGGSFMVATTPTVQGKPFCFPNK